MEGQANQVLNRDTEDRPRRSCSKASSSDLLKIAGAEMCGTALLVLLTCLPGCSPNSSTSSLAQRALTGGLVVALIVQCFGHVSGAYLNPTLTLAAILTRRFSTLQGIMMCAGQLVGGTLGAAALFLFATPSVHACVTQPASFINIYQALAIETMLGGCLSLACLASFDSRNRHLVDSWPLRIGFAIVALALVAGDLTGASMNPVRSFAPALLAGHWEAQWVYWVGPLSGACLSAALYGCVWRSPPNIEACELSPPPTQFTHIKLQLPHKLHFSP